MRYVGGGAKEEGCIFCNRLASADDAASLIVHREPDIFVIMNLFPYNTAHLMIVPTAHVESPETAPERALARLGTLLQPVTRALRRVLTCDGFNVGFNVGAVAGAGVAEHLHQHVVPRWTGDANFMPILAGTMVLPELIPVSYAKVRAELRREMLPPDAPHRDDVLVVATTNAGDVLLQQDPSGLHLPRFRADGRASPVARSPPGCVASCGRARADRLGWRVVDPHGSGAGLPRPRPGDCRWERRRIRSCGQVGRGEIACRRLRPRHRGSGFRYRSGVVSRKQPAPKVPKTGLGPPIGL